MEDIDEIILTDLTVRSLNTCKFVQTLRGDKYFFELMFLPSYFTNHFPNYSIEDLNAACNRLQANKFIEYLPGAYVKLNAKGANYCSIKIDACHFEMRESVS